MKSVIERYEDDLDGTTVDVRPHTFAVDGRAYEIDLSDSNFERLYEALRPYITAGRRTRGSHASPAATRPPRTRHSWVPASPATVRAWWRSNTDGMPPWREKGNIPRVVNEAFVAAHGK